MLKVRPSSLLGLAGKSYEAYCLDEAVAFFGQYVEAELEKVGHKPAKGEGRTIAARKARLEKLLKTNTEDKGKTGFADPALLFK